MKRKRKRRIIALLCSILFMIASVATPWYQIYAEDLSSQDTQISVSYEYSGRFLCEFPANIQAGEDFTISVVEYNLRDGIALDVRVDSLCDDNTQHLTLNGNDDEYVGLELYADNSQVTLDNLSCGELSYEGDYISFSTNVVTFGEVRAGDYFGIMRFCINPIEL